MSKAGNWEKQGGRELVACESDFGLVPFLLEAGGGGRGQHLCRGNCGHHGTGSTEEDRLPGSGRTESKFAESDRTIFFSEDANVAMGQLRPNHLL